MRIIIADICDRFPGLNWLTSKYNFKIFFDSKRSLTFCKEPHQKYREYRVNAPQTHGSVGGDDLRVVIRQIAAGCDDGDADNNLSMKNIKT